MREGNQGECVVKFLQDMGFEDINAHTYDKKSTKDSIALAIARKKVDDLTVISLVVCGNNYGEKWASNVSIGNGTIPEGFSEAAGKALQELDAYLNRYPPEGKAKIWISSCRYCGGALYGFRQISGCLCLFICCPQAHEGTRPIPGYL